MNRDLVFEGLLGVAISLALLYMTLVEIPFYPQEIQVQKVVLISLAACGLITMTGLIYGRNSVSRNPSDNS